MGRTGRWAARTDDADEAACEAARARSRRTRPRGRRPARPGTGNASGGRDQRRYTTINRGAGEEREEHRGRGGATVNRGGPAGGRRNGCWPGRYGRRSGPRPAAGEGGAGGAGGAAWPGRPRPRSSSRGDRHRRAEAEAAAAADLGRRCAVAGVSSRGVRRRPAVPGGARGRGRGGRPGRRRSRPTSWSVPSWRRRRRRGGGRGSAGRDAAVTIRSAGRDARGSL